MRKILNKKILNKKLISIFVKGDAQQSNDLLNGGATPNPLICIKTLIFSSKNRKKKVCCKGNMLSVEKRVVRIILHSKGLCVVYVTIFFSGPFLSLIKYSEQQWKFIIIFFFPRSLKLCLFSWESKSIYTCG